MFFFSFFFNISIHLEKALLAPKTLAFKQCLIAKTEKHEHVNII